MNTEYRGGWDEGRDVHAAFARPELDPLDVAERARVLSPDWTGGAASAIGPVPDPWSARQHDVKVGRNRRGATMEVKRRGVAVVVGSPTAAPSFHAAILEAVDGDVDRAALAMVAIHDEIAACQDRRVGERENGKAAPSLTRVADDIFRLLDDDASLIGNDAIAWKETGYPCGIFTADGAQTDASDPNGRREQAARSVSLWRSGISGRYSHAGLDRLASPTAVYQAQTRHQSRRVVWPLRTRVRTPRLRESERHLILRRTVAPMVTTRTGETILTPVTLLIAGTDRDDRIHIGNRTYVRGPRATRNGRHAARSARRKAARVARRNATPAVTLAALTEQQVIAMEPGTSLRVIGTDGREVKVKRGTSRRFTLSGAVAASGLRTGLAVVRKSVNALAPT